MSSPHQRIAIIVQARMGATRLPGKPLIQVLSKPLLSYLLERLKRVKLAHTIVVATTELEQDQPIVDLAHKENVHVVRGSVEDVLSRYMSSAKAVSATIIVRITGDCPLVDPQLIDRSIEAFIQGKVDYLSNTLKRTFPRGMDVEVFSRAALEKAYKMAKSAAQKEHVTPFIYQNPDLFTINQIYFTKDLSKYRWTVDTPEDLELIRLIIENLYPNHPRFGLEDIVSLVEEHPEWTLINQHIKQKEI